MAYLFSSESVSEGHPDKVADQISDALLDQFLAYDEHARCAIETFNTTGQVIIMGEVRSEEYVDLQTIVSRNSLKHGLGYYSCTLCIGMNSVCKEVGTTVKGCMKIYQSYVFSLRYLLDMLLNQLLPITWTTLKTRMSVEDWCQ